MFFNKIDNSFFGNSFQYFGSKILSLPQVIFGRIFSLFGLQSRKKITDYQWSFLSEEKSIKHLKNNLYRYIMAAVPKSQKEAWISPFTFKISDLSSLNLNLSEIKGSIEINNNSFVDYTTGLNATIASSPNNNELLVGFGAADSLIHHPNFPLEREFKLLCGAAFGFIGGKPLIYEQADKLIAALKEKFPEKKIILSGTCLGGSLAQYAALKNDVKAYCINSLALGPRLQAEISDENLKKAQKNIRHITIENDLFDDRPWITQIDRIVNFLFDLCTPGNFGKRFRIPCLYNSMLYDHNYPLDSFIKVLNPAHTVQANNKIKRRKALEVYSECIHELITRKEVRRVEGFTAKVASASSPSNV